MISSITHAAMKLKERQLCLLLHADNLTKNQLTSSKKTNRSALLCLKKVEVETWINRRISKTPDFLNQRHWRLFEIDFEEANYTWLHFEIDSPCWFFTSARPNGESSFPCVQPDFYYFKLERREVIDANSIVTYVSKIGHNTIWQVEGKRVGGYPPFF